ncbi:charged multivesicular body protein 3-like isoform X2 [Aquarana catesbeiana]|uniref:charged multivesicular body protein 3-like isoform X2 n=1 Tax=Aquarana catesbeiana TaxID=8400 RepID=UPI003CC97478
MGLFGKTQERPPKDLVSEWSLKIRKEMRVIDRQIRAVLKVSGSLQRSTEVMKAMQNLVKIPEIQATMRELSKEMMKAGIIEEMLEDTFAGMEDEDEMEEAADLEIDKILYEITAGALGKAPSKVTDALPEPEPEGAAAAVSDEEEDLEAMHSRLAALRS